MLVNKTQLIYGDGEAAGDILLCKSRDGKCLAFICSKLQQALILPATICCCSQKCLQQFTKCSHFGEFGA